MARLSEGDNYEICLERAPIAVLEDVLDEYVSVAGAHRDYGVVIIEDDMTVDEAATRALRESVARGDAAGLANT